MGETVDVPDVAFVPDHDPEAVHEVALVDAHVNELLPPEMIEPGFADIEIVGAATEDEDEDEDEDELTLLAELLLLELLLELTLEVELELLLATLLLR